MQDLLFFYIAGMEPLTDAARSPFQFAAWLVDLDGTLYRHNFVRSMMAVELALRGWPAVRTLRSFRRQHERLRAAEIAEDVDPFALQIRQTATRLNVTETAVADIVNDWMISRPGKWIRLFRRRSLLRAIGRFRSLGGKTALVSDYPAQRKLAALGSSELFDAVVACGEPGGPSHLKPCPAGYLLAAKRLAVSPDACLVIGDRADADELAARQAGMAYRHAAARWSRLMAPDASKQT